MFPLHQQCGLFIYCSPSLLVLNLLDESQLAPTLASICFIARKLKSQQPGFKLARAKDQRESHSKFQSISKFKKSESSCIDGHPRISLYSLSVSVSQVRGLTESENCSFLCPTSHLLNQLLQAESKEKRAPASS